MKRRVRWSHLVIGIAAIATLAIAAPALGGPSLKALVKKEVAKQIHKATGPPGANGINGINGADGTARAYAVVIHGCGGTIPGVCGFDHSKGVAGVTQVATGDYCVDVPGISANSVPAAVSVESNGTNNPKGNASAMIDANDLDDCPTIDQFEVITERQPTTTVRDQAGTGTTNVSGLAVPDDTVGFAIVVP